MKYSDDDIKSLYLDIDRIIKKKPQVSLKELSKELNTEIDLEQESWNVLGDLLLARAIEDSNLDFVKFLFKNKLRIISIASHEEESYHIIKARNSRSILNHAIHFGNTEILDLLLQSINTEQKKLESESKLYKLRKKLEGNEIYDFYHKIDQIIQYDREANNLQHLQEQGRIAKGIKLQDKCKEGDALIGKILLEYATEDQNQRVKDFLSKNGCNTTFPQQKQMGCIQSKLYELCQMLKDNALFTAVGKGNSEAVELLIASGANPEAQEVGGKKRTVLDMAIEEGNEKIVMLLISAINKKQEKQKVSHIETNSTSNSGNRSVGNKPAATEPPVSLNNNDLLNHNRSSRPTATVSPISTNSDNRNHTNEIPKVTTPNVEENKPKPSGNVDGEPAPPIPTEETDIGQIPISSGGNNSHGFINAQFSPPNEKETKYKESKGNFHTSLRNDAVGVVITGLFITAAVMVPSVAGAVICGIVAALALVATGLHVKDSTLPSYKEMEENRVECIAKAVQLMI